MQFKKKEDIVHAARKIKGWEVCTDDMNDYLTRESTQCHLYHYINLLSKLFIFCMADQY
jgi:hypothetical protein